MPVRVRCAASGCPASCRVQDQEQRPGHVAQVLPGRGEAGVQPQVGHLGDPVPAHRHALGVGGDRLHRPGRPADHGGVGPTVVVVDVQADRVDIAGAAARPPRRPRGPRRPARPRRCCGRRRARPSCRPRGSRRARCCRITRSWSTSSRPAAPNRPQCRWPAAQRVQPSPELISSRPSCRPGSVAGRPGRMRRPGCAPDRWWRRPARSPLGKRPLVAAGVGPGAMDRAGASRPSLPGRVRRATAFVGCRRAVALRSVQAGLAYPGRVPAADRPHRPIRRADLSGLAGRVRRVGAVRAGRAGGGHRGGGDHPRPVGPSESMVDLADRVGLDTLAELWRMEQPSSLPGALWALYLLRRWCQSNGEEVTRLWRAGRPYAPGRRGGGRGGRRRRPGGHLGAGRRGAAGCLRR